MELYEIVIRIHDPAFDKMLKKAVKYPKDQAMAIWQEAKVLRHPVTIQDGTLDYQVAPNDILQVRPARGGTEKRTEVGQYKRTLIGTPKDFNYVFEVTKTKRLKDGWGDTEYKEVKRVPFEGWKALSEREQELMYLGLKEEHLEK